jgi:hypothetical protein
LSIARRACVLVLVAGLMPAVQAEDTQAPPKPAAAGTTPAKAPAVPAKPAEVPEVDDELLEFLGSVDADAGDQDWIDYLSQTDIAKVAKGSEK